MTILALGPGVSPGYQQLVGNGVINLTTQTLATLGGATGVTFPNVPGLTLILLKTVTADPGAKITPGATILGQQISPITFAAATAGDLYLLGPFYALDVNAAGLVEIDFTTGADVSGICIIQSGGV